MVRQSKLDEVKEIKELIKSNSAVGILNMHKMPGRQLQQIRHGINAKIRMSRKSLIVKAMDESGKDLGNLKEKINGPAALIFTNDNPFRLFKTLKQSRSPASAKKGDVATKDIVVEKGSTGLPPGPAIGTLQKIGLKASVQGGKIAVLQDKVVCRTGEAITEDVAAVLGLLKIEPLEIGLDLTYVYEGGIIYNKSVLDVSTDRYIQELTEAVHKAVNLSVNTGYPTKTTIEIMIRKAFAETRELCVDANILENDFIDDVLQKAIRQATALQSTTGLY